MHGSAQTPFIGRGVDAMVLDFPLHASVSVLPPDERESILANPGFGLHFTDHMARASWSEERGWHASSISSVVPYSIHPAASVLHYAQEIFEGLKAFRHPDGRIALFRPDKNARRFTQSAARLMLPQLDEHAFVASVIRLVEADHAWVPTSGSGDSLYLRPYMFGSEAYLGVRPSRSAEYGVIASPAGAYFSAESPGISLWVTTRYSRASVGGTGAAKCGGNYASSLIAQAEAVANGCDQVLFTGGPVDDPLIEEAGTMNIFVITRDGRLLTPPLGNILEGVTRDSILALAPQHGLSGAAEAITLRELISGCQDGYVTEVFAAGAAAVITPITRFVTADLDVDVADGLLGAKTQRLREHLVGIQHGTESDTHGWLTLIDAA